MNRWSFCLMAGVCLMALFGCQSVKKTPAIRYCVSFPLDTTICVNEIPFTQPESSHVIVRMGDKVMVFGSYGMIGFYSYPEMHFLYKRLLEHDLFFCEDENYCGVNNGVAELFSWKSDSLEQCSSFVLYKGLPRTTVESLGNGDYVYADNYECKGLKEFHIVNSHTQEHTSKGEYPESPTRFESVKKFKLAYSHSLRVKPDKSRFVLYYSLNRRFRIYDRSGDLLHEVFLDYPPANNKVVDPSYERQYIHLSGVYTTECYIYLLNPDSRGLGNIEPECSILVVDWEGNLVARYRLDTYLYSFFVDETSKRCVGVGCQKGGIYSFFTFKLLN